MRARRLDWREGKAGGHKDGNSSSDNREPVWPSGKALGW